MSKTTTRYENVPIWFLGSEMDTAPRAEVVVGDGFMTLGFVSLGLQYVVEGRAVQTWFEGANKLATPKVAAQWAKAGDIFVGRWSEGGGYYLFSFELC